MSLFDKLLVGHLLCDWIFQTEWQAVNKSKDYRALFSHIGIYTITMMAILVLNGFKSMTVLLVLCILALSHALLDRGWFVIGFMKTFHLIVERQPERWLVIAVDQVLHILIIALAVLILSP